MHRPPLTRIAALALVLLGAVALATSAGASSSASGWSRISGPTQTGVQLGLARTKDGVLHVIWNRGAPRTSIFETRLSASGKTAGTSTVATGWDGNNGLALLQMPDGTLRLFATGTNGMYTFTAPAAGKSWTAAAVSPWGGAVAASSGIIGASLTKDGQPVTAWRGTAAEGVPPASTPNGYEGGMTESFLATDASSGAVVLSGETNAGQGGAYIQQILPSTGRHVVLGPGAKDWSLGTTGRIGAAGVYAAYVDGKAAHLYRYGGSSRTLARGAFWSATACAGPDGRVWIAWGDQTDGLFVTRTNRAAGSLEPVQKIKAPSGLGVTFLQCEGSPGPLDLFADNGGFWHTHLLAQLSVRASAGRGKATIAVRDAGDPVAGASVSVGGNHLHTAANGSVTVSLRAGSYPVTVSAPGYATASARIKA